MSVRITDFVATKYQVPLARPFATARSVTTKANNIVVMLEGVAEGRQVAAVGEAAPRAVSLTGDMPRTGWLLLQQARDLLLGEEVDLSTREATLASVRRIMGSVERLAASLATSKNFRKPFRGTLAGIEVALLDLAARCRSETIADLLGKRRDDVFVTAATISAGRDLDQLPRVLAKVRNRFTAYRLKGDKDVAKNLRMLEIADDLDREHGERKAHWLDLNEALDPDAAHQFLLRVIAHLEGRRGYSEIILEQPVPKKCIAELCALQQTANTMLAPEKGRVVIIADECLWDLTDYMELERHGGCGGINIKVPKAGGLLPGLDLAEYAHRKNPEVRLYVGGMIGTSDVTSWSLLNFAKSLPRLDYITTFPKPGDAAANFVNNRFTFKDKGSSRIAEQLEHGIGASIVLDQWGPFIREVYPPSSPIAAQLSSAGSDPLLTAGSAVRQDSPVTAEQLVKSEANIERIHLLEYGSDPSPRLLINVYVRAGSQRAVGTAESELPEERAARDAAWATLQGAAAVLQGRAFPLAPHDPKAEIAKLLGAASAPSTAAGVQWVPLELALLDGIVALSNVSAADQLRADIRLGAALSRNEAAAASGPFDYAQALAEVRRNAWFPPQPFKPDPRFGRVNEYDVRFYEHFSTPALDSHFFEREALRRGLNTERLSPMLFSADDQNGGRTGFSWSTTTQTSHVSGILTGNKQITRQLLQRAGLPTPEGRKFAPEATRAAIAYAKKLGFPLVLKPLVGTGGVGVVAGIQNEDDLNWAFNALSRSSHNGEPFIIERHVNGRDYRIFATTDKALSVTLREPASVVGDGALTIAELFLQKNEVRLRNPHLMANLIKLNDAALRQLEKQGLTVRSIPEPNRRVVLASAANLKQGGENVDVLNETHPSILDIAVRAVAALPGLPHAGVDLLVEDHRRPASEQSCAICELNCSPSQAGGTPMYGTPAAISEQVFEREALARNLRLGPPSDQLRVHVKARGRVQKVGFRAWIAKAAEELGLDGWARNSGRDTVEAVLSGPSRHVSVVASAMITGPRPARPQVVRTTQLNEPVRKGFRVIG